MNRNTSWNKSSKWYHKIVGESGHYYHTHVVMPAVKRLLRPGNESILIDFGCGQGVLARSISQETTYIGIDSSPKLIKQAQELDHNKNHTYLVRDVTKPLKLDKKATHISIILALQNMSNLDSVFKNVADNLVPKGELLFVVNHPCFRIPRQSGWTVNPDNKLQVRWISKYLSPMEIPITMHPGQRQSDVTWSYHHSLQDYSQSLQKNGFVITYIEELASDKESVGKAAKMENRSRSEIPLFMIIKAKKI